jgi:hypothetical protein
MLEQHGNTLKTKIATLDTFRIDLTIGRTSCSETKLALSIRMSRAKPHPELIGGSEFAVVVFRDD